MTRAPQAPVFIEEAFTRGGEQSPQRRKPWWQTARTPRQGFIMGGCSILIGAAYLTVGLVTGLGAWDVVALIMVGPGALHIVSATVLHRRELNSPAQAGGDPAMPGS